MASTTPEGHWSHVGGRNGRSYVGWEVDMQAAFIYSPQLQVYAGCAIRAWRVSAEHDRRTHLQLPFVTATYVFAGESPGKPTNESEDLRI